MIFFKWSIAVEYFSRTFYFSLFGGHVIVAWLVGGLVGLQRSFNKDNILSDDFDFLLFLDFAVSHKRFEFAPPLSSQT